MLLFPWSQCTSYALQVPIVGTALSWQLQVLETEWPLINPFWEELIGLVCRHAAGGMMLQFFCRNGPQWEKLECFWFFLPLKQAEFHLGIWGQACVCSHMTCWVCHLLTELLEQDGLRLISWWTLGSQRESPGGRERVLAQALFTHKSYPTLTLLIQLKQHYSPHPPMLQAQLYCYKSAYTSTPYSHTREISYISISTFYW